VARVRERESARVVASGVRLWCYSAACGLWQATA